MTNIVQNSYDQLSYNRLNRLWYRWKMIVKVVKQTLDLISVHNVEEWLNLTI